MPDDEAKVPTIILKLTDPEAFNVECNIETDRLCLMRVMLLEALRVVDSLLQDQDAIKFQHDMNAKAQQVQAARAMMKKPLIKM